MSYVTEGNEHAFLSGRSAEPEDGTLPDNLNTIDGWLLVTLGATALALVLFLIGLKKQYMPASRKVF